ncbi:hypothetical protein [Streptomyces sp. TS71-3]|uniref:hypothetical protein n=1 Tax=Streptomyces sp. TS71-3 TaxID=2733862 RepID=UPI001B20810E|nr:hypothetical protein [Streptomyces sp. TS71-3]GHJ41653.1 hypothetical protein Sm713_72620 [Streptomyces sp. TS71-3]
MHRTMSRRIAGTVTVLACAASGFVATATAAAPASADTGRPTNTYACSGSMYQATNYATDARGEAEAGKDPAAFRKLLDASQLTLTDGMCAPFVTPVIQTSFDAALGALQDAKTAAGERNWSSALAAARSLESSTRALYAQLPDAGDEVGTSVPIRTADAADPTSAGCAEALRAAYGYTNDAVFDVADIFKIPGQWTWTYYDDFLASLDATQTRLTNGSCASVATPENQAGFDRALEAARDGVAQISTSHAPEATAAAKEAQAAVRDLVRQFGTRA